MDDPKLHRVDLTSDQLRMLEAAIYIWSGAAHPSTLLVRAMGFADLDDLLLTGERLNLELDRTSPLTRLEWTQLLMMAEIAFGSDIQGAGTEWSMISGLSDTLTLRALRDLQNTILPFRMFPGQGNVAYVD